VSEDVPEQSDSALEGDLTPTSDLADHNLQPEGSNSDEMLEASPKASGMLVESRLFLIRHKRQT